MTDEELHKSMSLIACVEPLIAHARFCVALGDSFKEHDLFDKALACYAEAEAYFIVAGRKIEEILASEWPPKFTGLEGLITTGYM